MYSTRLMNASTGLSVAKIFGNYLLIQLETLGYQKKQWLLKVIAFFDE